MCGRLQTKRTPLHHAVLHTSETLHSSHLYNSSADTMRMKQPEGPKVNARIRVYFCLTNECVLFSRGRRIHYLIATRSCAQDAGRTGLQAYGDMFNVNSETITVNLQPFFDNTTRHLDLYKRYRKYAIQLRTVLI